MAACVAAPSRAHAGGFYLGDRGVRATGRAGALVAGADAPDSLWYNPAGLGWSGRQLQLDATLVLPDHDFTRIDGGGEVQPTVEGSVIPVPMPGLSYSEDFGLREWTFGVGVFTPTAVLEEWPDAITVDGNPEASPSRYSLISLAGTALAHLAVGAAWRPLPRLSIGATAQLVTGGFRVRTTLSACDRAICTQPENPDYDALAEVNLSPLFAATFGAGVIYDAGIVRFGASFLTPYSFSGDATIRVRPPSAAAFDGSRVDGDQASTSLAMPWILRAGVELRPLRGLRVELAVVGELWSTQKEMTITPHDVWLRDVVAIGDYEVGPVTIPRHMRDTLSVRLGGEHTTGILGLRAGLAYENGAFDDAYLTPLTIDSDKLSVALGASFEVMQNVFLDLSFQHFFMRNREVRNSAVPQANPIRPPPVDIVYVGNGDYGIEATTFGLGLRWAIDPPFGANGARGHAAPDDADDADDAEHAADVEAAPNSERGAAPERAVAHDAPPPVPRTFAWPRGAPRPGADAATETSLSSDAPEPTPATAPPMRRRRADDRVDANPYRPAPAPAAQDAPGANPYRPQPARPRRRP